MLFRSTALKGLLGVHVSNKSVGEDFATVSGHHGGYVRFGRTGSRSRRHVRREDLADLDDREIVRDFLHGLDEIRVDLVVVILRGKTDFSSLEVGDVDESGGTGSGAGGLEHGGG